MLERRRTLFYVRSDNRSPQPWFEDRVKQDRYPTLCVLTRTVARAHKGARICKGG